MFKRNWLWFLLILLPSVGAISIHQSYAADNMPPEAKDDTYLAYKNTPLIVAAPGVLANDIDGNGDHLTAILESTVEFGQLTKFNADGSFTYTPSNDFSGLVSFTYHPYDGKDSGRDVNVFITVSTQNPPGNEISDIEEVIDIVKSLATSGGPLSATHVNALIVKLQGAIDKLEQGKEGAAINKLESFINQVNAYMNSRILDQATGQSLIDDVRNIINSLK
ncbi:MAG: Ig-like domain-containing protein [Nitrosopumilaceae archaeon]